MFRLDWFQPQPGGPIRLVVSGELSEAAHDAVTTAVARARREAAAVELDLHDVTRVDRSVVIGLAELCEHGVSVFRCPAYLERWLRDELGAVCDRHDRGER